MFRQKNKKNISEFYTARETTANAISCIPNKYRYAAQQDGLKINYLTNTMNRTISKPELGITKDKYRILAGKLHIYSENSDKYLPVERHHYIDLSKLLERMKADADRKYLKTSQTGTWEISEEPNVKVNLCSRETQRQLRSTEIMSSRSSRLSKTSRSSLTGKNFYVTQGTNKTTLELLSERCVTSAYQLSRQAQ